MKTWKTMERQIAVMLGDWWGCQFRRTPSSGAWNTQSRKMGGKTDFAGDIVAPVDAKFPFSVECKAYKDVQLYQTLTGKANIFDWWKQCVHDTPEGLQPLLVMKEDRKKPIVVLRLEVFNNILVGKLPCRTLILSYPISKGRIRSLAMVDLETFLSVVPADKVRRLLNVA